VIPYYADDLVTLYHGDALTLLPTLAPGSARVVILDPPYSFDPVSFHGRDDAAATTSGSPTMLLHQTFIQTYRILELGGIAPTLTQWRRMPDTSYLAALAGLRLSACVAWIRSRTGTGGLFRGSWDPILVGSKGAPTLRDRAAISNVLHVEPVSDPDHPYAKRPALWGPFMSRVPEGGLVVDPYAGLCASAIAARATGHRWIGFEATERYCEAAARRLSQGVLAL
jgi:site-specific DNA-methyltransferase (adenine-specific)